MHDHHHPGPGGHHAPSRDADRRWLAIALAIIASFMGVQVVAGLAANSLALLSDAGHSLTDAVSVALALVAARLAIRPAAGALTFGWGRAEIVSAQINGLALILLAAIIVWQAIGRLAHPPDVNGAVVIVVGLLGASVNVAAAWALSRAERRSLNVQGARAHVIADLYVSLSAVIAGLAVVTFGARIVDPLAALFVAGWMLRTGVPLVGASGRVLLEASPQGTDPERIRSTLADAAGVVDVHDLHLWEITSGFPALSAHVLVRDDVDCHRERRGLEELVRERFAIEHTTLQVDHGAQRPASATGVCTVRCC